MHNFFCCNLITGRKFCEDVVGQKYFFFPFAAVSMCVCVVADSPSFFQRLVSARPPVGRPAGSIARPCESVPFDSSSKNPVPFSCSLIWKEWSPAFRNLHCEKKVPRFFQRNKAPFQTEKNKYALCRFMSYNQSVFWSLLYPEIM